MLGRENLEVGGRTIPALVLNLRHAGQVGNNFSADFKLWFDPATGIWLKREVTMYNGEPVPNNRVTGIKLP